MNEKVLFIKSLIDKGITQTEIGRKLGYSRSQVNKFIEGGKVSDEFLAAVDKLIKEYDAVDTEVKDETQFKNNLKELDFVLTRDAKNILGVCKATESINGFTAILGNAGTGKTEAVKHFVKNNNKAVYIRCNCLMATRDILKAIARACGTTLQANSKSDLFEEIVDYLIDNPRVLIFDEIDQIMPIKNVNKIETLRNLHDTVREYGNSLIIVGSLAVEHQLKKRNMSENYGQIDSRIDYLYKTQGLSETEIMQVASEFDITDEAKIEMSNLILRSTKGGIRWFAKILDKCLDIARMEGSSITKDIVKDATSIMMI